MSLPPIHPQSHFLYDGVWTAEIDSYFIYALVAYKNQNKWENAGIPNADLLKAGKDTERAFGCQLSYEDLIERKYKLEKRFLTFKEINNMKECDWATDVNIVSADTKVWKSIFKKNPFAKAYYHNDDAHYLNLAYLFGDDDDIKQETCTLINISDSTHISPNPPKTVVLADDDDEVNSPGIKTARRCLSKDNNSGDEHSSTAKLPCPDMNDPLKNAFPPPHKGSSSKKKKDGSSSSCASSGTPWWKRKF